MISSLRFSRALVLICLCVSFTAFAAGQQYRVPHRFSKLPDGSVPTGALIADNAGNLYGTTQYGGVKGRCSNGYGGCGTVFELSPPATSGAGWTETILYGFENAADGRYPYAGLIMDSAGNLYGTTTAGGTATGDSGSGTVFELSPPLTTGGDWTETTLYTFTGPDGAKPEGSLIFDHSGNLYGTTAGGGNSTVQACSPGGCGTVFELTPPAVPGGDWSETVLHAFTNGHDGAYPMAGLELDTAGNLYGTTYEGGVVSTSPSRCSTYGGCGTVFELHPSGGTWTEYILHHFAWTDGSRSYSSLVSFKNAMYGTTSEGGSDGDGTVFKLTHSSSGWTLTPIFSFNQNDGSFPLSGVSVNTSGDLFGVTETGGADGDGEVYELSPPATSGGNWTQNILHSFAGGKDGEDPIGGVLLRGTTVYGTTSGCCNGGFGTVFSVTY